jgi:hypothetical protein
LLQLEDGTPAAVRVDIGRGSVIAIASASAFTTRDVREQGGGVLFGRLVETYAPRGPVIFDEYHLGVGQQRSTMRYLRQIGAGAVAVQLLVLALFALWRVGARFGRPRIDPPPEPAGTASYVDGVATLYQRARDPVGAARILFRRALVRIGEHHHLSTTDPKRMIELLERRKRKAAADAVAEIGVFLTTETTSTNIASLAARADALVDAAKDSSALDKRAGSQ